MKLFRIRFKALSPIHIGYGRKLGIINCTRYYIPAKNIWAALTANLTRIEMNSYSPPSYLNTGKKVNDNFIFTNFYPVIPGENGREEVCLPKYKDNGFYYGPFSQYEFESKILDSYTSTAINYRINGAEDASLHEIEFMKNKINGSDLIFEGYLIDKNDSISQTGDDCLFDVKSLKEVIGKIEVGGERKYGFGRLSMESEYPKKITDNKIWDFEIKDSKIIIPEKMPFPFTIPFDNSNEVSCNFTGNLEPIVGMDWCKNDGAGQKISKGKVCISPGSRVNKGRIDINELSTVYNEPQE